MTCCAILLAALAGLARECGVFHWILHGSRCWRWLLIASAPVTLFEGNAVVCLSFQLKAYPSMCRVPLN